MTKTWGKMLLFNKTKSNRWPVGRVKLTKGF
jgi:hypothetical protein